MSVCLYAGIYVFLCLSIKLYIFACISVRLHVCIYICIHVCMCVCMYVRANVRASVCTHAFDLYVSRVCANGFSRLKFVCVCMHNFSDLNT